ncbi:hypothetical protein ACIHFE_30165 [Streptomyces sp. NPDC052396]|uniref:hypothetical protein n=1 Tax=Streptomyces sp. NPDC052396 TaxID=3365689 RepID=UPI0037D42028
MTSSKTRCAKGVVVSAVAAHATYWAWASLTDRAWRVSEAHPDDGFAAGFGELVEAQLVWVLLMPLLLWAGMRVLGEKGNSRMLAAGSAMWLLIGGRVETKTDWLNTEVSLVLFALLCGLLSLRRAPPAS